TYRSPYWGRVRGVRNSGKLQCSWRFLFDRQWLLQSRSNSRALLLDRQRSVFVQQNADCPSIFRCCAIYGLPLYGQPDVAVPHLLEQTLELLDGLSNRLDRTLYLTRIDLTE